MEPKPHHHNPSPLAVEKPKPSVGAPSSSSMQVENQAPQTPNPLKKMVAVASIAAGIQFGWALQLSLLTPYVQLLGIPHTWAAFIWLCGPISGMLVQPIIGYHSDSCTSRFGRRRPFIAAGTSLVGIAVILIAFAADLGLLFGDNLHQKLKPRAVAIFVIGFWILDVANNMLQGPCRALLADLSGDNPQKTRTANSLFSFFMAVGNVLGYAAGSYTKLHHVFPFAKTAACDVYCANLKSCFFISIALLIFVTSVALSWVKEKPLKAEMVGAREGEGGTGEPFLGEVFSAFKDLPKPMKALLLVTSLNWVAWFPFLLFDTDWMGREVYGGEVGVGRSYDMGVHAGSLGLMLNSLVLGFASLGSDVVAKRVGGVRRLWGGANFLLAGCLAATVIVTKMAEENRHYHRAGGGVDPAAPPSGVKAGALVIFSVLGIPLSATYTIPFALASIFSSDVGAGQGLSLGVLNLAIVVPQMVVSVLSGPWDALFGGGNLPAFVVGAVAAILSGILAFTLLPSPPPDQPKNKGEDRARASPSAGQAQ